MCYTIGSITPPRAPYPTEPAPHHLALHVFERKPIACLP